MTYISGPITGVEGWQERFIQAENWVKENLDTQIKTPRLIGKRLEEELGKTEEQIPWEEYMRCCLRELTYCDTIYAMKGWEDSKGAVIEVQLAYALGLRIIFEQKMKPMAEWNLSTGVFTVQEKCLPKESVCQQK